ncbi:MerR family transcriptional regulator [Mycobacterium sp.]|uniref:MerR family transcriptional regulator n=1 Tax=Mycobacterium sp. TaxID=1785 RepID=UPI0012776B17|nr:MerR family transcriptional regulator [Mycobacterium sp.]KAA8962465.1 MAG: MerR family transcriptional regulator [Mycobacterium sp.]
MTAQLLTLGQAARAAGVSRKAMRVYEAKGLLPPAERSAAGYRLYSDADVELLTFIRRARQLGLHLDDIRHVLAVHHGGDIPCGTVLDLMDQRITEIDELVAELLALRTTLSQTRARAADCTHPRPVTFCPIIEDT